MGLSANQALVKRFLQLYPGEAALHLNQRPKDEILALLQGEPVSVTAKVFLRLKPDVAASLIVDMQKAFFVDLFTQIEASRGAMLLARLDKKVIKARLAMLPRLEARS